MKLFASDDCRAEAVPFVCQSLFQFCDASGRLCLPSAQQFANVTTGVCADVWQRASAAQMLPTCELLPGISTCTGNDGQDVLYKLLIVKLIYCNRALVSISILTKIMFYFCPCPVIAVDDELPNITCRDDFFRSRNNRCLAQCDSWEQDSSDVTKVVKTMELFSASFGLLASVIVIVASFLRRKTM